MAKEEAKLYKVKVVPKDLKQIPGILPYNQFISGEPKEVELTKNEIHRCMCFGDVFMDGEDEPVNAISFKEIVEFEEKDAGTDEPTEDDHKDSTANSKIPTPVAPARNVSTVDTEDEDDE